MVGYGPHSSMALHLDSDPVTPAQYQSTPTRTFIRTVGDKTSAIHSKHSWSSLTDNPNDIEVDTFEDLSNDKAPNGHQDRRVREIARLLDPYGKNKISQLTVELRATSIIKYICFDYYFMCHACNQV